MLIGEAGEGEQIENQKDQNRNKMRSLNSLGRMLFWSQYIIAIIVNMYKDSPKRSRSRSQKVIKKDPRMKTPENTSKSKGILKQKQVVKDQSDSLKLLKLQHTQFMAQHLIKQKREREIQHPSNLFQLSALSEPQYLEHQVEYKGQTNKIFIPNNQTQEERINSLFHRKNRLQDEIFEDVQSGTMDDLKHCVFQNFDKLTLQNVKLFDSEEVEFSTVVNCESAYICQGYSALFEVVEDLRIAKSREIKSKSNSNSFIQSGLKATILYVKNLHIVRAAKITVQKGENVSFTKADTKIEGNTKIYTNVFEFACNWAEMVKIESFSEITCGYNGIGDFRDINLLKFGYSEDLTACNFRLINFQKGSGTFINADIFHSDKVSRVLAQNLSQKRSSKVVIRESSSANICQVGKVTVDGGAKSNLEVVGKAEINTIEKYHVRVTHAEQLRTKNDDLVHVTRGKKFKASDFKNAEVSSRQMTVKKASMITCDEKFLTPYALKILDWKQIDEENNTIRYAKEIHVNAPNGLRIQKGEQLTVLGGKAEKINLLLGETISTSSKVIDGSFKPRELKGSAIKKIETKL